MHKLRTLAAGIAVAATAAMVASAVPALADPPVSAGKQIVPKDYDVVSVGANTDENLFNALAGDYNKTIPAKKHRSALPYLYTWNATKPGSTSTVVTKISTKAGCSSIVRPNGSGAGLTALDLNAVSSINKKDYCIDFARSSSGRSSTAPAEKPGGVGYVALAEDAVTWAVRDVAAKGQTVTYAPKSLSLAQLRAIFLCTVTTWGQVGGTAGQPIKPYLPQTGSGTLSFWLKALGITTAGSCVNESLEENQGLSKEFNSPNAIFIYSVGDWIAQKYNSPLPGHKPAAGQNAFGTDQVGYLGLGKINGVSALTLAKVPAINKGFRVTGFTRTLYDIVRYQAKGDHIPANLDRILGRTGYFCHNTTATRAIESYGFLPALTCGSIS
ncbi:MAG TPA: substrate-binding domain-containing protein [Trebonia sp.]|nr:substrate-binding domain-containing protein [Trebonia sp.]